MRERVRAVRCSRCWGWQLREAYNKLVVGGTSNFILNLPALLCSKQRISKHSCCCSYCLIRCFLALRFALFVYVIICAVRLRTHSCNACAVVLAVVCTVWRVVRRVRSMLTIHSACSCAGGTAGGLASLSSRACGRDQRNHEIQQDPKVYIRSRSELKLMDHIITLLHFPLLRMAHGFHYVCSDSANAKRENNTNANVVREPQGHLCCK